MDDTDQQPITNEQAEEMLRSFASKAVNTHTFLTDVIKSKSTTRTGNLEIEELGMPRITQRGVLELALFTKETFKDEGWNKYFSELAEIQTGSSLSKKGFLLNLSVTNKKELADTTPEKKPNRGMFGFGKKKE